MSMTLVLTDITAAETVWVRRMQAEDVKHPTILQKITQSLS